VSQSAVSGTGSIVTKDVHSFKIKSAKKVASRLGDSVCGLRIAHRSALENRHAFAETDPIPSFLWSSEFSVVRGPLFYAAEKPEKSATGGEIGRDVERDPPRTKSSGEGCAFFGAIF
jgi:hypothetical protein